MNELINTDQQFILDKLQEYYSELEPALRHEIAANAMIREFKAGEILMKPGQYFKSTMLITKGRVKVYKESGDGSEFFMYYLEPGNACALSMICAARQEQSELLARTTEETEVILIPIALMDNLMTAYKTWYYFVLGTFRNRFEELLTLIDHTVFKGLDERLEFYLKKQRLTFKTDELKVTHEEIAGDLGTSRVVISRLLKSMEQAGKVKLNRNYIDLKNLPL
ncbi:MAG: Crp/Fnr family transcriptional regulator [Bacteroidetes bacterium]|jgi:CRP/FNR family transcriptional regulator|nr:Crp/Fnr family transcriptional regulator [Bacteroidota bacterium]MBK9401794.1 Crp/Fnr family transcriptional regulator [Bacteroidota bacterium]MBL0097190.1 Crp/Fnr family transcriptional regulator [Bacteroidota bacterium]